MALAIEAKRVTKSYGDFKALDGVELAVPEGQIRAVIGPNGAGKSTLFGVLSGEFPPTAGSVSLFGEDITGVPEWKLVRMGMARAFQVARIFPKMSVIDNVRGAVLSRRNMSRIFWWPAHRMPVGDEVTQLLEETGLETLAAHEASILSQGDRKRLELAMALALDPRVLLLDEPTAGMSPEETAATVHLIKQLWTEHEFTIVLTEHDMSVVFGLAQEITVLHLGQLLCSDSPEAIRQRPDVAEIYLGSTAI